MGCAASSESRGVQETSLTPEQEARVNSLKKELVDKYKLFALVALVASVTNIVCGVVIIAYGYNFGFPVTASSPIWSGCIILAAAGCGLAAGFTNPDQKTSNGKITKQDRYIGTFSGMMWWSFIWMGQCIGYAIWIIVTCAHKDPTQERCPAHYDVMLATNSLVLAMDIIILITAGFVTQAYRNYHQKLKQVIPAPVPTVAIQTSHNQYGGPPPPPTYSETLYTSKY